MAVCDVLLVSSGFLAYIAKLTFDTRIKLCACITLRPLCLHHAAEIKLELLDDTALLEINIDSSPNNRRCFQIRADENDGL